MFTFIFVLILVCGGKYYIWLDLRYFLI